MQVLKHAKAVAVFTILKDEFRSTEADGSGIIVVRQSDGTWSPPTAVLITASNKVAPDSDSGDIFDCVCIFNEEEAVEPLKASQCTFGDIAPAPTGGPIGGSINDTKIDKPASPVWTYVKSKGHWIEGAQLKGLTLSENERANAESYGIDSVKVGQILGGEVKAPSGPVSQLLEVLKAIETNNHNSNHLPSYSKSPGDYILTKSDGGSSSG
jgi:SH3 domain-containing YSC84-like protein 1